MLAAVAATLCLGRLAPARRHRRRPGQPQCGPRAGASAPDILVQQVTARLRALGAVSVRTLPGVAETVHFPLPMGLGDKAMGRG